ncbi:hypothetical protein Hamer_G019319 [Homarus americanus]|uniref:Uncharacterized protein n=1 Tax=Homarus americanus TaxID=6706 RepID=A0A8J5JF29_HOMAM|nr:hypothetical protein Hamer_G019319 [Homarus americanus]
MLKKETRMANKMAVAQNSDLAKRLGRKDMCTVQYEDSASVTVYFRIVFHGYCIDNKLDTVAEISMVSEI